MLEVCFGPGLIEGFLRFLAIGFGLQLHAFFHSLFFVKRLKLLRRHGKKLGFVFLGLLNELVGFGRITSNLTSPHKRVLNCLVEFPANEEIDLSSKGNDIKFIHRSHSPSLIIRTRLFSLSRRVGSSA